MNIEPNVQRETARPVESYVEEDEQRKKRRRLILFGLLGLLLVAAVAYFMASGDGGTGETAGGAVAGAEEGPATSLPTVSVIVPGSDTVTNVISASGTLDARRELPVGVAGEGGQISRVLVDAGDWVGRGQVLAIIDTSVQRQQIGSAHANVDVARADLALAQSNLDRARQLIERGFISRAEIERLTATRDAARARVNVAQAQHNELHARTNRLAIRAPASGMILQRMVEPGQVVSAGSGALFSMASGGEMEMNARVSEGDLARLSVGQTASITPVGTTEVFEGQIWQLSPTINPQTRQGTASIALNYNRALRPGGFANARIVSGAIDAPRLPESAVQSDDDGNNFVFIIDDNNRAVRRPITVGSVTNEGVIVSDGLRGNERVVQSAGAFLNEGDEVIPRRISAEDAR